MVTKVKQEKYTSKGSTVTFKAEQSFDSNRMRHYLNGQVTVMHCHHYATLFSQLALDAAHFGGTDLLTEASAETFWGTLRDYYKKNRVEDITDRIAIAEQYCSFVGLGDIKFEFSNNSGQAIMTHSHVDEGWLKKWGKHDKPVNYMGKGYIQAAWAAIYGQDPVKVKVEEVQSLVCGDSQSKFAINW